MIPRRFALLVVVAVLIYCPSAWAVVESIGATATAEVEEEVGGTVVNSDFAFEELDSTTGNLPLIADVQLRKAGEAGDSGAAATTTFSDPRPATTPNPHEFGIAAVAFSQADDTSYTGLSVATESRAVTFLAEEIGESDGTALQARSYFFVDGLIVLWGKPGQDDLSGALAELSLKVEQTRGEAGEPAKVLGASLSLDGRTDSGAVLTTEGGITPANVIVLPISDLVPELGAVQLVLIPTLAIPYEYPAEVGEQFKLDARIEGYVSTPPGTGAAVLVGVSLAELSELIEELVGEPGSKLANALDVILSSGLLPAKPLQSDTGETEITVLRGIPLLPGNVCGMLGIESLALLLAGGLTLRLARGGRYGWMVAMR